MITRKKLVAGNWKMNKTSADAVALVSDVVAVIGQQNEVDVVVCPPFTALESARGFVWNWLRKHLDLRVTPQLAFRPDRSMEHAAHIQSLLAGLRPDDAPAGRDE